MPAVSTTRDDTGRKNDINLHMEIDTLRRRIAVLEVGQGQGSSTPAVAQPKDDQAGRGRNERDHDTSRVVKVKKRVVDWSEGVLR